MTIDQTSHITKRYDDGTTCEEYYHNGLLDRPDGPAIIWRWVDGSTSKEYFREGKFVNKEGLAAQSAIPDVTIKRPAPKAHKPDAPGPA